jgi:DNA-binding NtrC family response regulator
LSGQISFSEAEEEFEKEIILDALRRANFIQSHAAEILGISRRILKYKMDKLGIQQQDRIKQYP